MLKTKTKNKVSASFVLLLTICSILMVFPLNPINSGTNAGDINGKDFEKPLLNAEIGEDPWWNASYQWRQCINISNPGSYNLTDNFISIEFDYTALGTKIRQADLTDLRIVENYMVRNYYVKQDFPSTGRAIIWFETNSTASESEYDTYMYFGNNSITYRGNTHINYDPSGTSWWSFEEGSGGRGSTVVDSLNNANATLWGRTGTYSPDYDTDSAVGSYSLNFDGSNDFLYINDEMYFQGSNIIPTVTVSCWFKTSFDGTSYSDNWAFFDFDRSEYFNFYIRGDTGGIGFSGDATGWNGGRDHYSGIGGYNNGEWHFACVVYDGYNKIIYVDDDPRTVYPNALNGLAFGTGATRYGFIGDGSEADSENGGRNNRYFDGNIDEIRYFDYAVSADEVQWLANYYVINTDLLPVTERAAAVTIIVKDVDDRLVPGAEVSLWENSTHILEVDGTPYTDYTLSDGSVSFTKVPFGSYNITVNYTLVSELYEETFYDSREIPMGDVDFKGLVVSVNVTADLWTIDFEVEDWDGAPLNYGHVEVSNFTSEILETLPLDSAGETTFRWLNQTSYNYTVYYDNVDYDIENPTPLNQSTITRTWSQPPPEHIKVEMLKLEIIILDDLETVLVEGATVRLTVNGTNNIVTELKTDENGTAYGQTNKDLIFWYKRGWDYNITLWIVNTQFGFKVNDSDQYFDPDTPLSEYNYTLLSASTLIFEIALNFQDYISQLLNATVVGGTAVLWGQTMCFYVNYSTSDNAGVDWIGDDGSNSLVTCDIKSTELGNPTLYQLTMNPLGNGNFTGELDSGVLSAGDYGKTYLAIISGIKAGYKKAEEHAFVFSITPVPTGLTIHNYTTLSILSTNEVSQYYNELINVTCRYYDTNTNNPLPADTFTYNWDYGSGSVNPDPMNPDYYTIEIDTAAAANVGKYPIEITAGLENYTKIDNFGFYINILSRPTTLNDIDGIVYISQDIYIFKELNFTFEYEDAMTSTPISSLDEMSYLLQKIDENGDPIPGTLESGSLIEGVDTFILDLDIETREDGEYSIIVTLDKLNYDHRIAIISLTIKKRVFQVQYLKDGTNYDLVDGTKFTVGSGARLRFTVTLTDPNNNSRPIERARVYLTFRNTVYNYSTYDGNGVYSFDIPTTDAFFMPETFTATLTIEKQYFSTNTTTITIVVNMHELLGIPTFYLLMIIGAVAAVVVALASYRIVQQRRIPTFVKKARKMKSDIKGRKTISESLLYPSKEEYIIKTLGDRWEALDFSLDDVLGLKVKKGKELPEVKGEFENLKGGVE